nr:nonribosomal peptide synthetase vlms-like [Quercus suber]POF15630.1 putative acyl-coa synthetase yngi [Quercus suber]
MASDKKQLAESRGEAIKRTTTTLTTILTRLAREHSDDVALICRHQPADFLYTTSRTAAAQLYSRGVRKGMRIAAFLHNGVQHIIGLWAAALLGCAYVPINAVFASMSKDCQHMLGVAEANVLMAWDGKVAQDLEKAAGAELMKSMLAKVVCDHQEEGSSAMSAGWMSLEDILAPGVEKKAIPPAEEINVELDDTVLVIFTSGTTSLPKGVRQTNRSLVSAMLSAAQALRLDSTNRSCNSLPFFHIFGIIQTLFYWVEGGTVCMPSATFDPAAALRAIEGEKLTNLPGPPSLLNEIANHPTAATTVTDSLAEITMSAATVVPEAIKTVGDALRCNKISSPFGMSEGTPITWHPYENLPIDYGKRGITTGPCTPGARVRICEPKSRKVLERDVPGELHVGGPMVVPGYLGRESDDMYEDDGDRWMITGDQALMNPDGEVYILGRYKDLIIRAGENIAPSSIEAVMDSIPGIESQVVGVSDEVAGEVPVAVIRVKDDHTVDDDEIYNTLSSKLGKAFIPAHIVNIKELGMDGFPKTASGKPQKTELRGPVAELIKSREGGSADGDDDSILNGLHQVWAQLLGLSTKKLSVSAPIQELADSITIMRASNTIKRKLGLTIGPHQILEHPSIEAQAKVLQQQDRTASQPKSARPAARQGPPKITDVVHCLQSDAKFSALQQAFADIGSPMGLSWQDDVEDVLPVWDWGRVMLRGPRAQSWNHRHAFATSVKDLGKLRECLEQALTRQAMLRTLAVQSEGISTPSHVIIRASSKWYKHVFTEVDAVDTAEDLKRLVLNDAKLDWAAPPGPLFRVVMATIKDTKTSGFVYQAHHSCFDGLSLPNLVEDLQQILEGTAFDDGPRTSYKSFADNLFLHRQSVQAQNDCDYHVRRLRGLGKLEKSLWPFQRAQEWFKGDFTDIAKDLPDRKLLDGEQSIGVDGVKGQAEMPAVQQLKQEHGVAAPSVFKAALALLNSHYTSQTNAVFTNYEASREWPFQEPWIRDLLPNAMDVNGPTLEAVLNVVNIDRSETCLSMMQRVQEEQTLLTQHSHVPLLDIQSKLGDTDGGNLIDIMRRQILNWLPGLQSAMAEPSDSPLTRIQMQSRSDVGLLWNCGMVGDVFHVTASYDDAQLRASEVRECVERWLAIAKWMTDPDNWSRKIGDCPNM